MGVVAGDELSDAIAEQIWTRRDLGESYEEIAAWLVQLGYRLSAEEVAAVAAAYGQRREEQLRRASGTGPDEEAAPR
jgi:hypothetical protein